MPSTAADFEDRRALSPPRAAKAAIPVLAVVSVAGIAALVLRRPGLVARS